MARRTSTTLPEAHGEPLGDEEVRLTKQFFGFDPDKSFVVPPGVREHFAAGMGARGAKLRAGVERQFRALPHRTSRSGRAGGLHHAPRAAEGLG